VPSGTKVVTSTGTVSDVLKSEDGCDSVNLTINVTIDKPKTNFNRNINTLTAVNTSPIASFQWLDCDKQYAVIAGETNKSYSPTNSGVYALAVKEDTCTDTSACLNFLFNGIQEFKKLNVAVYPNPTKGAINIMAENTLHNVTITLMNTLGETLKVWHLDQLNQTGLFADLPAAFHLILIESDEGSVHKYIMFE
jgi:hypothetical protein